MPDSIPLIDPENGCVHLPSGGVISPDLTLDTFEADSSFAKDKTISSGVPWWGYGFSGGLIDGREFLVSIHFYNQLLLSVDLTVSHYPPDAIHVSEKIEAAAKDFHDRLLEQLLGQPSKTTVAPSSFTDTYPTLNRSLEWVFPWGSVASIFIGQSCSSLMLVRYGNRFEEADELDRQRQIMP
jgi:hypothetical protein